MALTYIEWRFSLLLGLMNQGLVTKDLFTLGEPSEQDRFLSNWDSLEDFKKHTM